MDLSNTFKGKKVFLTGHTGFKGAWLLQMLNELGADVKGFALAPENENDLYNQINGDNLCYNSVIADIRDEHLLKGEMVRFQPDFVFHLAAQAFVRRSYQIPSDTFATNVQGTINVLEGIRLLQKPCIGIIITTDKVYENLETGKPFIEHDPLGGYDPYSASKAAAEIAISSYRNSFFNTANYQSHQKVIVSMRAGNVIGGGDFSQDRIIPDIVKAVSNNINVVLRNPLSIRPWQHVLEPLNAYLEMAAFATEHPVEASTSFNIGPEKNDVLPVEILTQKFINFYGSGNYEVHKIENQPHEAEILLLDNRKIKDALSWQPRLSVDEAIQLTAEWYASKENAINKCTSQIKYYNSKLL